MQVSCVTLAFDGKGDTQLLAMNSVLLALQLCDHDIIPWSGPLADARVGVRRDGEPMELNPDFQSGEITREMTNTLQMCS